MMKTFRYTALCSLLLCSIFVLLPHDSGARDCPAGMIFTRSALAPSGDCMVVGSRKMRLNLSQRTNVSGNETTVPFDFSPYRPKVWLDASDPNGNGATVNTGTTYTGTSWVDKMGNAANPTIGGTGGGLVYTIAGTKKFMRFDGSDIITIPVASFNPVYTTTPNMTMFIVYRQFANTNTMQGFYGNNTRGNYDYARGQYLNFQNVGGGASNLNYAIYLGTNGKNSAGTAAKQIQLGNLGTGSFYIYSVVYSNAVTNGSFVSVNGTKTIFTEDHTSADVGATNFVIGAVSSGFASQGGQIDVAEVLIYNTAFSESEVTAMTAYLNTKWGVY